MYYDKYNQEIKEGDTVAFRNNDYSDHTMGIIKDMMTTAMLVGRMQDTKLQFMVWYESMDCILIETKEARETRNGKT